MADEEEEKELDALFERYLGKSRSEFNRRKIHRLLTPEILAGIPDADLGQAIRDFTHQAIGGEWVDEEKRIPALGPGFVAAYFTDIAEAEISNGGFNQLFYNCGREAVVLAKSGAELLGMPEFAALLARSLEIEERERPRLDEVREAGSMETFFESYDDDPFKELDDAYMELSLDSGAALVRLVRSRPDLFCGQVRDGPGSRD